jgi:beta-lactamase regulating signal transducer with metallopeptidase domain
MEILGALIRLIFLVLWVWALIDILKSDFKDNINKIIWLLVVFVLNFLGVLPYYFIGRGQKA